MDLSITPPVAASYPIAFGSLAVIVKRLRFHSGDGLLAGLNFKPEVSGVEGLGAKELPALRLSSFSFQENNAAGSAGPSAPPNNTAVAPDQAWGLSLYTPLPSPLFSLDPDNEDIRKRGVMEWVARIIDAIETTEGGAADALLEKTMLKPILSAVTIGDGLSGAMETIITIQCTGRPYCRAERRLAPGE